METLGDRILHLALPKVCMPGFRIIIPCFKFLPFLLPIILPLLINLVVDVSLVSI
jgi:hypothetical protein